MTDPSPLGVDWANVTLHLWRNDIRWYADVWLALPDGRIAGRRMAVASGELGVPMTHRALMTIKNEVDALLVAGIGIVCDPV